MIDTFKARRVPPKSMAVIVNEWDSIAALRGQQLRSGADTSFESVLVPTIVKVIAEFGGQGPLLDVGCGVGELTLRLSESFGEATGIDPSARSIEVARHATHLASNVQFHCSTVQEFRDLASISYATVVANMVLMDTPDLPSSVSAMSDLCSSGGLVVLTITHPWFWPMYWGYEKADWFDYSEEIFIESEFRITAGGLGMPTTHVHRPLSAYTEALRAAGLSLERIIEPRPVGDVPVNYTRQWHFPRFVAFACLKRSD